MAASSKQENRDDLLWNWNASVMKIGGEEVPAMAIAVDLKGVVKHIVDGTISQNLCRICLLPLGEVCENIFTKICKDDREFCIADVLEMVCGVKILESDNSSVCANCFIMATTAYKFYLKTKCTEEILHFYVDELQKNICGIEIKNGIENDTLCITLPEITPVIDKFDYNIQSCLTQNSIRFNVDNENLKKQLTKKDDSSDDENLKKQQIKANRKKNDEINKNEDEDVIVVIGEDGKQSFYKFQENGLLELVSKKKRLVVPPEQLIENDTKEKIRRKRDPMIYQQCSKCPVKYRFLAKLKIHMKQEHNIDLFVCKVCKAIIESEKDFNIHLKSHTDIHRCNICDMVFKKRDTIISHLKWHEEMKNMSQLDGAHVCELCGYILPNEEQLKDHYDKKHDKKFTCFYCGRMYKGEISFEMHIKKHEAHLKPGGKRQKQSCFDDDWRDEQSKIKNDKKRVVCSTCGKYFVDDRSLMWHSMLHTNERPYACDVCGRGFVSANRRNQHVLCAHTMPTKRCPLCPALFHLRSMVNTHIKKVHLKTHKRRNRTSKHQQVPWKTEAVPIQELSVSIQNELLELKTSQEEPLSPEEEDNVFEFIVSSRV